jgi:hypothetical protein
MTLNQFEELCIRVLNERLPVVRDASEHEGMKLLSAVCSELENVALSSGLEVCQRGAYLLVLARYDMELHSHRHELGVPDAYFEGVRWPEQEAFAYLHERRCGAPARHVFSSNEGETKH